VAPLYWALAGDRLQALRGVLMISTAIWVAFVWLLVRRSRRLARGLGLDGDLTAELTLLIAVG
jgi:hypothetical protein